MSSGGGGSGGGGAPAPAPPSPATTVWDVGGLPTEVLELRSTAAAEVCVLVVPGNPGAAPYYAAFMQALHVQLGGRARVTAVSNLGMDGLGLTPAGRVYSLEDQVAHKAALLTEHFVGPGRLPVVVLAHSIGAYMSTHALSRVESNHEAESRARVRALDSVTDGEWRHPSTSQPAGGGGEAAMEDMHGRLVAALEEQGQRGQQGQQGQQAEEGGARSNVAKLVCLFPFFQVDPDCARQRRLARLTRHHALVSRVASGLGWLPMGVRRGLVRLAAPGMDAHAVDTTAQVFSTRCCVENGLYMGQTEFEALAAPADWWLLRELGGRVAVFAAPDDVWFKRWKWDAMHREVPGVESYYVESLRHGFCVSVRQSEDLAARIAPIVEAALRAQPAPVDAN